MLVVFVAVLVLTALFLAILSVSDAPERFPAAGVGRVAGLALAVETAIVAMGALFAGLTDGWNDQWSARLLYGLSGLAISFAAGATGLYVMTLSPGAYDRQHPTYPSAAAAKATEITGKIAGIFLLLICVIGLGITAYFIIRPS